MRKRKTNTTKSKGSRKSSLNSRAGGSSRRILRKEPDVSRVSNPTPKFDNPYAALSATNEAILRAKTLDSLYQGVCDAAVYDSKFLTALIAIAEPDGRRAKVVAVTGPGQDVIRNVGVSIDDARPEGRGLIGIAYRTLKPCITNDYRNDPRVRPWRKLATDFGYGAGAAVPIVASGRCLGAMVFCASEKNVFNNERLMLLERMVANVAYAIENLRLEAEHRAAEHALRESEERFRSLATLSSDWYWELDAEFCFIRVEGQNVVVDEVFGTSAIGKRPWEMGFEDENGGQSYRPLFDAHQSIKEFTLCWVPGGASTRYFRISGQPIFDANGRFAGYRGMGRETTEEMRARHSVVRLGKMHTVLNETIEACVRAKTPDELYKGICDAAVHGSRFRATLVFLLESGGGTWMRPVSYTGPKATTPSQARISVDPSIPQGQGLVGTAFRNQKPCISNDFIKDERSAPWRQLAIEAGIASAAALPLIRKGKSVGVLIFYGAEIGEFDEEMVTLLERLLANVSFALDKFEQETELRKSEERFRGLTGLSSDWYWEQDAQFRFTRLEGRHVAGGESLAETSSLGLCRWEMGLEVFGGEGWSTHRALLEDHQSFRDLALYRNLPDGTKRYISVSGEPMFGLNAEFIGYRGIGKDITAQKLAEERIQYLATHDGLTGLPNRTMFSQVINLAIESARRYSRSFAVLFIDLDRFKIINDTLGHEAGDKLLQEVAARLKQTLRSSDVVARMGGDEFVVMVQEVSDREQVAAVARKLLTAIIKPMVLRGQECRVSCSIGICMYPTDAEDEQTLMKNADLAMYQAKEEGKNNFQFYTKDIKSQSLERLTLETNLRRALERNEFSLNYQAKLDLKNGDITGVEALLRWQHPEFGTVPPTAFIPLAEETGLIVPIGRWVLRTACAQNAAWQREGLPPICVAVNLSMRQFTDDDLLDDIADALRETGMAAEYLELELTEGMVMQNVERATRILAAIKKMGVRIAIDDFGTGYSSLAQIKRFPIDTLKVDRSFIRDLSTNPEDRAITEAIIAMGKTLSLTVVAEGVETKEQESFLREHECDEFQGFYFSRPTTAENFAALLREHAPEKKHA